VHPTAPAARFDVMGLIPILRGWSVCVLNEKTATIECKSGAKLTFYPPYRNGRGPYHGERCVMKTPSVSCRRQANKRWPIINGAKRQAMTKTLTTDDIRDLLTGFAAAIKLDQIRVDAVSPRKFHRHYSPSLWRTWRRSHLDFINQLLATVKAMPPELTRLALAYDPLAVRETVLDLFASAASGVECSEQFETAALFFGWLIVRHASGDKPTIDDPRTLMMQWLPATDPLRIAEDPECGYGRPAGFVS
jgi:hypothetical protein